jgi:hypothetical protein
LILSKDDLVSQISLPKRGEFFAEGRYLPLRGEDFLLRGDDFPLRGDDFPVGGRIFRRAPKINALSDSHETLHGDPHGHVQQKKTAKIGYSLILGKDDLVSQVSLLRGENFLLRGDIYH